MKNVEFKMSTYEDFLNGFRGYVDERNTIKSEYDYVVVHCNEESIKSILRGMNEMYGRYIDLKTGMKNNRIVFECDRIVLSFSLNEYIKDETVILVSLFQTSLSDSYSENQLENLVPYPFLITKEEDELSRIVDFCVSNKIHYRTAFKKEDKRGDYSKILLTQEPFKLQFQRYGIGEESLDRACEIAIYEFKKKLKTNRI